MCNALDYDIAPSLSVLAGHCDSTISHCKGSQYTFVVDGNPHGNSCMLRTCFMFLIFMAMSECFVHYIHAKVDLLAMFRFYWSYRLSGCNRNNWTTG